jgi:predicted MFS family arabinose efflux permease
VLGPLTVASVLALRGSYQAGFAVLVVPAMLALGTLIVARVLYPRPQEMETASPVLETQGFPRAFWLYLAAVALIAAGYADFPLIAYHFETASVVPPAWIPVLYAVAMGVDALAAILFGRWFDRIGLAALIAAALLSALFAPLVFAGGAALALIGMALWGVGMGAQESIMRAAIAGMVPPDRRGSAYGVFNTGFGLFWFLGSALIGVLYDISLPALIAFSVTAQLAAVVLLVWVNRRNRS